MSRGFWVRCGLVAVLVASGPVSASAAVGFDIGGATYLTGVNGHTQTYSGKLDLVNDTFGGNVGGVAGSPPTAFGAEIYASMTAKLGLQASLIASQTAKYGAAANVTTQVRGADGMASSHVGEAFSLATTQSFSGANYMDFNDEISASLDLYHGMTLEAGGRGCFSGCLSAGLKINLGEGSTDLVTLTSTGGAILGVPVGDGPYSYTDPSNILTINGDLPNFDAKSTNVAGGPGISSRQGLFSVSIDVAQAFATAVGLPFPLSGEIGGFDYTILSAKIGAGLDVVKTVAFEAISAGANYVFSTPVSVYDAAKGAWSDLTTSWFTKADGSELMVKAPGAASVGVTRYDVVAGNMVTDLDLVGYISGSLTALGLSGYGIDLGPLLDLPLKLDIGSIDIGGFSEIATMSQVGQTFNLTFASNLVDGVDPCSGGCSITGFVDQTNLLAEDNGGGFALNDSAIRRVTNLGVGCLTGADAGCNFDTAFGRIARQTYVDTTGQNDSVSGEDIRAFQASLAAPEFLATQSDMSQVFARLRALGYDPLNPTRFPGMGPGAPFPTAPIGESRHEQLTYGPGVPEPSTWLMLIGGFAMMGAALRRRRLRTA